MRIKLITRNSNFLFLWLSQVISSLGDRVAQIGFLSMFFLAARDDGSQVALITFFTLLPFSLAGPFFGVLADRCSRKQLMVISDFSRAVIIGLIPVLWIATKNTGFVIPLVFILGTLNALFATSRMSLVTTIIPKKDLVEANSLIATTVTMITLVGTVAAGYIVKILGVNTGFYLNSVTYIISGLLIFKISAQKRPDSPGLTALNYKAVFADLKAGMSFLRRHKIMIELINLSNIFAVVSGFGYILVLNYGSTVLKADSFGFGLLLSSLGMGMVLGGLILYKRKDRINYNRALYVSFLILGVFMSIFLVKPGFYTTLFILFCAGVGGSILPITLDTILHRITPDEVRAKVFSVRTALTNAVFLVSLLLIGRLIKVVPVIMLFAGLGILNLVVFLGIYLENKRWGYQIFRGVLRLIMKWIFQLKVSGFENLPATRRVIFAGNHTSLLDGVVLMSAYPGRIYFLAVDTLFTSIPWGWFARKLGYLPVKRGGLNKESIKHAVDIIKSGFSMGIFPEGRITPDGQLAEGKEGVVLIARLANADIIPFAIEGAYEAWPVPKKFPRPFPIEVRFGKPVDINACEVPGKLLEEVMGEIARVKLSIEREGYLRVDPDEIVKHLINIG